MPAFTVQFENVLGAYVSSPATLTVDVTAAPLYTNEMVSQITVSNALLSASIAGNYATTIVYFQWGSDQNYGHTTATNTVTSDTGYALTSATAGLLMPNATYHYRVVASNIAGTTYGPDQQFTTPMLPLSFSVPILQTNGTLHFSFTGSEGVTYELLASTNLINWAPISTASESTPGHYDVYDTNTALPARYYILQTP